jgi:hypothetical protein
MFRFPSRSNGACIAAAILATTAFAPASYGAVAHLPPVARNGAIHIKVHPSTHAWFPRLAMTAVNPSAVCVGGYRWIQHDSAGIITTVPLHC